MKKVFILRIKKVFLSMFLIVTMISVTAQLPGGINIEQLSDSQLMQYAQQFGLMGLSETELISKAKERGLNDDQIQKLKVRIQSLNNISNSTKSQDLNSSNETKRNVITTVSPKSTPDIINGLTVFGSEIFTKENLTFEPNVNIASPKNYILGTGDEIKVDIYGFSDKGQNFKITPDGIIRYPNIGPIKIAGLTVEETKTKLNIVLSKIYPGLKTGNTNLQVTLGQIRSIRVNLIGEINKPGTYTISSLSTIANALYAAGGPTKIGSYRNIQLIRSGKPVTNFDLYDYLLKGDLTKNLILQDDDVIRVSSFIIRVELRGAFKRNAIYEAEESDKLSDIIKYAGGLTDNANRNFVRVMRFGTQEKEVITLNLEDSKNFVLQTGDQIVIDEIANSFNNRIIIEGAVYYMGNYSIQKTPTLKDLILLAKPKENAYLNRAYLRRFDKDYKPEIIGFNLQDVLNGKFNINLNREDSIYIYSNNELTEKYSVYIQGEVNNPGLFSFSKGIKVQDLILMAGGFKDGAEKSFVEISRRIRNKLEMDSNSKYAIILNVGFEQLNELDSIQNILEPFDIVNIRKAPNYSLQISANIEGEVKYPGVYSITSNKERVSDLLKRAGGIKDGAYPEGAYLLRKIFENISNNDTVILKNKISTLKNSINDSTKAKEVENTFNVNLKIVGIKLDEILSSEESIYNIVLQDGDILKIPNKLETVQVFSGVYFPKKIVYKSGITFKKVISECGGVVEAGNLKKAYIVYPNGEVKTTKSFLLFRRYPIIKSGSEVYIPLKSEKRKLSTTEVLAITTGIATLATMVITISNLTK